MVLLIILGIVLLLFILLWYINYYRFMKGIWDIPAPKLLLPLLGHILEIKKPSEAYWIGHRMLMKIGKGKSMRGCLGIYYCLAIGEPEFLEHIMTHSSAINKSIMYRFLFNWLGTGLLTSGGEKWRSRRKLLTPAYHFKILEQFIDVFDKNGRILVQKLQKEVGKKRTDVYPYVSLCALDTICETAMGTSVNAQENENSEFVHATKEMTRILILRGVTFLKQFDFTYQFTEDYQIEKKSLEILHNYTLSVIDMRRKELLEAAKSTQTEKNEVNEVDNIGFKQKMPFLDLLLQSSLNGAPLSDEDIREEVDTFMFEGHDTVSAAMSFCIYCISKNPHVQEKLAEEQQQIYESNPNRETTYNDLQEMRYLEMVIKETLRLYPSVPFYGRHVSEDLKYRNYVIKKGTQIAFSVYTLHHNPEYYPDPEVFDPERFTLENQAKRHPFSYLPFSAGSRNCVGQKFAMLEMKSTISKLIRNFVFTEAPNNEVCLTSEMILSSATGVNVTINKRIW